MKRLTPILVLALLAAVPPVLAQPKIAYVNFELVAESSPQIARGKARLDEEFRPRNEELEAQQERLTRMEERLVRDGPIMTEDQALTLERDVRNLRRQLQRDREDAAEAFNFRLNEVEQEVSAEIERLVQEFARDQGYDMILISRVLFVSDEYDITNDVIEILRREAEQAAQP